MPTTQDAPTAQGASVDEREQSSTLATASSVTEGLMEREIIDQTVALQANAMVDFQARLFRDPWTSREVQEGDEQRETSVVESNPVDGVERRQASIVDLTTVPAPLEKALAKIKETGMPNDVVEDLESLLEIFKLRLETLRKGACEKDPRLRAALWRAELNALDSPLLERPRRE
ncbi:hypothetical protein AAWM_06687 [Aspergillus awamori]|uniref:Uncharacterized protein n=1 Tax=Aspergillus awamori TaxID=105351 RepID=A0A401KX32_ASPAW|nr:hypothetical protein AAWM_06687 [Aspergillus awamori]GKZ58177.1 hypothetical protein AnigIFM49718_003991 [Aspergillus niger]